MLPEEEKNPFFVDSHYYQLAGTFSEPIKKLIPEDTFRILKEKTRTRENKEVIKQKNNELFKKLAEPQIEKKSSEQKSDAPTGYTGQETQNLDRLIENTIE